MERFQTGVKINLDNLINNYRVIKNKVGDKKVIPVIKADAYGHGAEICAKVLMEEGADLFAVSSVYEAMCLREYGIDSDILILGYVPDRKINKILENNIIPAIYNLDFAKKLNEEALKNNTKARVHIKINTGMNRLGFKKHEIDSAFAALKELTNLEFEGIFSHFATSDEVDKTYSKMQYEIFEYAINKAKEYGFDIKIKHIANSAAITDLDEYYLDGVRAGIVLYGIYPSEIKPEINPYKPVMSFHTSISNIFTVEKGETIGYGRTFTADKKTRVAVMCVGYADGYNRKLSNKGKVLVNGKYECSVIGNVCMDMTMLEIPMDADINIGDSVEIFGENISVSDLAILCETIPYELLCCINKRVKREYILNSEPREF
ncbi:MULTISPECIES: alanine racemase [Anaerofustis]|uniref:alanine racemase n=1 Tax=Anaerofustis TaxID=264995 RepID=UPI0011072CFD|nr:MULTISPECIES: alanine racemase [Anaerofustis]MCO8194505.1 alanine racemase [Anaerofustis sp. NSJ-163]